MVNVSDRRGFTLVELAVSMVVIGILLGLGMSMVGPLMTTIKVRESKENLGAAVESINSWASGNNRLPDSTLLPTVVRSSQDAWGRDFIYVYVENLAPGTATKDTICGRRSTLLKLVDTNISATAIDNVAFLVFSKGDDDDSKTFFTSGTLTPVSGPLNVGDKIKKNAYLPLTATGTTTITTDSSLDLVRWVTIDELRTKIGCQGAQLKILNNELPPGNVGNPYSVNIYADGGVKFPTTPVNTEIYEWCWTSTTTATLSDLTFNCVHQSTSTTLAKSADACSLTTGTWQRCSSLTLSSSVPLSGLNPPSGSYDISLSLRDSDGNITSKTFVLTINPN